MSMQKSSTVAAALLRLSNGGTSRPRARCCWFCITEWKSPGQSYFAAGDSNPRRGPSENVQDFRRLEADALAGAQPLARLIFTTDRQFPRGDPATAGCLVTALDALLSVEDGLATALFLRRVPDA